MSDEPDFDHEAKLEDLREAVEEIPDGDPESIGLYTTGTGNFIINAGMDDEQWSDDYAEIDDPLREAGFEPDGHIPAPGMIQQNVKLSGDGED